MRTSHDGLIMRTSHDGLIMRTRSKSRFKPRALEVMRQVERTGESVIIADHGKPTLELRRYSPDKARDDLRAYLKGKVVDYTEPIGDSEWDATG